MPLLKKTDDELTLALSGAENFQAALDTARSITPRRFDPDSKLWIYPADPDIAERIMFTIKPNADASILGWIRSTRAEREQALTTKLPDDAENELLLPFAHKLFPFQRALVEFAVVHPRIILADDMGLGKTVQAIGTVNEYLLRATDVDPSNPRLVVCPATAKGVWAREIDKWLGSNEPLALVDAKTPAKREQQLTDGIQAGAWVLVNYEQLRVQKLEEDVRVKHRDGSVTDTTKVTWELKQPLFGSTNWLAVIADEAHRCKSHKALQTRGLWMLDAPMKLALTGTPLMNNPAELWPLLKWLYPEQYGRSTPGQPRTPYWTFFDQYVESYDAHGRGGRVITGVKNPDGLRFELKNRLIRRTKAEKLNLPAKTREYVPVTMNPGQAKAYAEVEDKFWAEIVQAVKEGDKQAQRFAKDVIEGRKKIYEIANGAVRTVRQRQILCSPALLGGEDDSAKFDAIMANILDNSHQQHVVFSEFVMGCGLLVARLQAKGVEAEAFTGEVSDTAVRTEYENRFQRGEIDVMVGTLGAMRESITLHAANIEHFCERAWVPGWNEQAEDRCHRQGQTNPVTILIYEGVGTVDTEKVRPTNDLKELIVSRVVKKDEIAEAV